MPALLEAPTFDLAAVRADFPILATTMNGKPLVYLDNAATSQKPRCVLDALIRYYEDYNANVHRGVYWLAEKATAEYERARRKVAGFINADSERSLVFARGTTEALNLVRFAWAEHHLHPGDEILVSEMEHHSNLVPWQLVAQRTGASLRFLPVDPDGFLELDDLDRLLTKSTKLVCVTHMSNVLGTINPIERLVAAAHEVGALIAVDGAQSVPHLPVDVQRLGCDFMAFSSHKMCGPMGTGALYAKPELLEAMEPFQGGGEMITQVAYERSIWNDIPWKFEAGTPNVGDAIAFGVAVDYLSELGMEAVREHEKQITAYALERLRELGSDVTIYGQADPVDFAGTDQRGGVVSFNFSDIHPHDLAQWLDQDGIAVRAGHHCAMPLVRKFGVAATIRASFYLYNTHEEVDALIAGLHHAKQFFG